MFPDAAKMTTETPENPEIPETPEAPVAPPPPDIRRRLQQLLSTPERDRTDAQWDEIVELEIRLAPGNRADAGNVPGNNPRRDNNNPGRSPSGQPKSRHPQKTKHFGGPGNKHRKPKPPPSGGQ
jgi:hypothetical protein